MFLDESPTRGVSHSRSSDALRKISQTSGESELALEQELLEQEYLWERTHSLSTTQQKLDDAIRDLEEYIAEDLASLHLQRRYSSNDSAMGGSEAVISPLQPDTTYSEPSTLNRKQLVHDSVDSAFSNYSSPTNSSEGMHHTDVLSVESDAFLPCNHIRMSSEISNVSAVSPSPVPESQSPEPASVSPPLGKIEASSLPALHRAQSEGVADTHPFHKSSSPLPTQLPPQPSSSKRSKKSKQHKVLKSNVSQIGTYSHDRSPILTSKDSHSETHLSTDHTPTESTTNITTAHSGFSLDSHMQGTVI